MPPTMPDLEAFKVVPPNQNIRVEDLTLPDGTKMVGPDGLLIPPARSFSTIVNAATRVYSYRFDEAMRDNFVAARAMRRDAFLEGLFEERILPTINREWNLEVDDDRDPEQAFVRDSLARVIRGIRDFDAMKRALLDGVWFGRAGVGWSFKKDPELDNLWSLGKWDPVHGDSIQFSFDGHPCILMDAMTAGWYASRGAKYGPPGVGDLVPTDRGGTALQLHRPMWRERYAIHQHILRKADYFEGEMAGSVQGVGLRGLVYWQYVVRSDALTWMLAYMQAVGQMDLLVFNYPAGNAAAKAQQELNAQKIIGKAAIACPRDPKGSWPAVEQIQMNSAGLAALQKLVADYFDRHIERLFVGQSMSSGADKGTGLGGTGRAEFTRATKDEILVHDTNRHDQTMTFDLVRPLKKYNFPWAKFPVRFKSVMPDLQAQEKVMNGKVLVSVGVPIKADEFREAAGYSRPEPGDDVIGAPQMGPGGAPPGGAPGAAPAPSWMGAPGGPPAMLSRGRNPTRYARDAESAAPYRRPARYVEDEAGGQEPVDRDIQVHPGEEGVHAGGERMWTHPYTDRAGNRLGVAKVIPRYDGETVHVEWVGPEDVEPGEVSHTLKAGRMRGVLEQLVAQYPDAQFLTGLRRGGARKDKDQAAQRVVKQIPGREPKPKEAAPLPDWFAGGQYRQSKAPTGYMGFPGGGNTYVPRFGDKEPVDYVRPPKELEGEDWLEPLTRELDKLTAQDLDGIKVDVNTLTRDVRVDVMDWGDPKVGRKLVEAARRCRGVGRVEELNEAARPAGRGWVSLYRGRNLINYGRQGTPLDPFLPPPDRQYENGNCSLEVAKIAHAALRGGFRDFKVVDGHVDLSGHMEPHTWLNLGGQIIDPTGSMFDQPFGYIQDEPYATEYDPEAYIKMFRDVFGIDLDSEASRYFRRTTPAAYHDLPHKYCSTQVQLTGQAAIAVLNAGSGIPETDLAEDGRETDAHVTVRWGLHDCDPEAVAALVSDFGPIRLKLTGASVFPASEKRDSDVIKIDVESPDLRELNRLLGSLPNTQTHPTYSPHATVAYVRPGTGEHYAAQIPPLNLDVTVDGFVVTDRLGRKTWVSTTGGQAGDSHAERYAREGAPTGYAGPQSSGRKGRHSRDQERFRQRRAARPPEDNLPLLVRALEAAQSLTQGKLARRVNLPATAFKQASQLGLERGVLERVERPAHANGGGPKTFEWRLKPSAEGEQPEQYAFSLPDDTSEFVAPQDASGRPLEGPSVSPFDSAQTVSEVGAGVPAESPQDASGRSLDAAFEPAPEESPGPQQEPYQPQPPVDLDYSHPDAFVQSVGTALGMHGASDEERAARAEAGMSVARKLPRLAYERLQGRLTGIVSLADAPAVGEAWRESTGKDPEDPEFGLPVGFYDPATGHAVVNGVDPAGVFAHEMAHAIDNSRVGPGGYDQLSTSDEWKRAWRAELASGDLTDYAAVDFHEGLAEFFRYVYADADPDAAQRHYPRCFAVFAGWGLV